MTPTIVVSLSGVLCALLVALVGAVWRLGSRVGEMQALTSNSGRTLEEVLERFGQLDAWKTEIDRRMDLLQAQWATAHRLVETVAELRLEVGAIKTVCRERKDISLRIRRASEERDGRDDNDCVPEIVGCPLTEEQK